MFKRRKSYYKAYRGRGSSRNKKLGIAAFIILLALGAAVVYFIVPEFIVFTSDGFHFTFVKEPQDEPPSISDGGEDENFNIVIDGRPQNPDAQGTAAFPRLLGVQGDISSLTKPGYGKELADAASDSGCNTICFQVKGDDGIVHIPVVTSYSSQNMQSADSDDIKEALSQLKADRPEIRLCAVIVGLRDNVTTRAFSENAVRTANTTWLDYNSHRWINPYSSMASEYLCDLLSSCAAAGFDAVLFDDVCFPSAGRFDMISWANGDSPEMRYEAIEAIMSSLVETANRENVALCMALNSAQQENDITGQRVSSLSAYCHTIFIKGTPDAETEALVKEGISEGCDIGWITSSPFSLPENEETALIASSLQ